MKRLKIHFQLIALGAVSLATPRAQAVCELPNALIVLDQSSSMVRASIGGKTLWAIAKDAVSAMLRDNGTRMNFGLMLFPSPNQCSPGSVIVPVGPNTRATIENSLQTAPPYSGNYTPMAESLDVAAQVGALRSTAQRNSVVLITDGWQYCSDATATADRFKPVDAVKRLKQANITTYVVGFGSSVDVLTLNKLAKEGGTMRTSTCNQAGTSASATNNCYYQANSAAELTAALASIGIIITNEICDGLDNNCDSRIDEALVRPCTTPGMTGDETCASGQWAGCRPVVETCGDGIDNNADGRVDEGCDCAPGATTECGTDVGVCEKGIKTCGADGHWGACAGGRAASAVETCDGLDDDCDGQIDNGAACPNEGGMPQRCGCGGCAPACQNGECFNGGACVQGYCIVNRCPAGMHCEGQSCVAGDPPPQADAGPVTPPPVQLPPPVMPAPDSLPPVMGAPDEGCACGMAGSATDAAPLALIASFAVVGLLLWRRRRRHPIRR